MVTIVWKQLKNVDNCDYDCLKTLKQRRYGYDCLRRRTATDSTVVEDIFIAVDLAVVGKQGRAWFSLLRFVWWTVLFARWHRCWCMTNLQWWWDPLQMKIMDPSNGESQWRMTCGQKSPSKHTHCSHCANTVTIKLVKTILKSSGRLCTIDECI